jgi:hypothetical protein
LKLSGKLHFASIVLVTSCSSSSTHRCTPTDVGVPVTPARAACNSDSARSVDQVATLPIDTDVTLTGEMGSILAWCNGCCSNLVGTLSLRVPSNKDLAVVLRGWDCYARNDKRDCPLEPDGHTVMVRGKLQRDQSGHWSLSSPALCEVTQ